MIIFLPVSFFSDQIFAISLLRRKAKHYSLVHHTTAAKAIFLNLHPGPGLSQCNPCSCIGPHASGGPAPWCLGNYSYLPDTLCAWEFSRNAI